MNGLFEVVGGLLLFLNTWRAWRDGQIRGLHPAPMVFFWSWGLFNLWYYRSIHQPWSAAAGLLPCLGNTAFIATWAWFWRRDRYSASKKNRSENGIR